MNVDAITVGCYVMPADATGDPDHTHTLEGTVWGIERHAEQDTGEIDDHLHVVRVRAGVLQFSLVPAGRVGSISPPHPATIDGLLRVAGRHLEKEGRKVQTRVTNMIKALRDAASDLAPVDVPSIFAQPGEDIEGPPLRRPGVTSDQDKVDLTARLWGRYLQLDHAYQAEVRRTARMNGLTYLDGDAVLSLGDSLAYDAAIKRWERLQATRDANTAEAVTADA